MRRMKNIEVSEIIDRALYEWYSERGMEVPDWKSEDWWQKYMDDLDTEEEE